MNISIYNVGDETLFDDKEPEFVIPERSRMIKDKIFETLFINFCIITKHIPYSKMWSWTCYSLTPFDKFCTNGPKYSRDKAITWEKAMDAAIYKVY
jgi:hypothetical protein